MSTEKSKATPAKKPSGNLVKPTNDVVIGGRDLDVIYNPALSAEFILAIKERVTESMSAPDLSSFHYEPARIMEAFPSPEASGGVMSEQDAAILEACYQCYDYIEI